MENPRAVTVTGDFRACQVDRQCPTAVGASERVGAREKKHWRNRLKSEEIFGELEVVQCGVGT